MDPLDIILSHGTLDCECSVTGNFTTKTLEEKIKNKTYPIAELMLMDNNIYAIRTPNLNAS
ncbi:hypothetical protein HK096_010544, partial [Nowakowskiella sp. JEL0078]